MQKAFKGYDMNSILKNSVHCWLASIIYKYVTNASVKYEP